MRQEQFKDIDPPLWVAWHQALASIRVRFIRQFVTTLGISLGIAFFACVQVIRLCESGKGGDSDDRLKWLVATSLVMCLVGITNSMLMSVAERYREIGTIKCLGASDGFVVKVFFFEAAILGAIGSLLGSMVGALLMAAAEQLQSRAVPFSALMEIVFGSVVVGIVMTILAAIAPAIQAAKMPAAAALRVEV